MANAADKIAVMTENLADVGMNENEVSECLQMLGKKQYAALDRFLADYRKKLLNSVHKYSERIDCLDYFTYTLKKNGGI